MKGYFCFDTEQIESFPLNQFTLAAPRRTTAVRNGFQHVATLRNAAALSNACARITHVQEVIIFCFLRLIFPHISSRT